MTIVYIFQKPSCRSIFSSASAIRRCAVELTGRNSVSPSTIPRKTDNKKSCICSDAKTLKPITARAPPHRVRPFGSGPLLPLPPRTSFHRQSFRSSRRTRLLQRHAVRDRPEPPSRISLWAENRPYTRCHDKFRCDLSADQSLSPHSESFLRRPLR